MSWSTKQNSAMGFLDSLEQFVLERNLPLRILDSIRDLKSEVENADEQSLDRTLLKVESFLKHMGKKYQETGEKEVMPIQGMVDTFTMENVADRIKEIMDVCLAESQEKSRIYANKQVPIVLEAERQLREIQHTREHYEEIKNAGRFQNFCNHVEKQFNKELSHFLNAYADSLCQSYTQAITKVKAILTKIKDGKVHVSQREFWIAYDSKVDLVKSRIQSMAGKIAGEQKEISQWASSIIPKLNESRKKLSRKRIIGFLAPWLGILFLALSVALISDIGGKEEEPVNTTVSDNGVGRLVNWLIPEGGDSNNGGNEGNPVFDLLFGLPNWIWLVALVLYSAVYVPFILKKSRNWFCDEVAEYLVPELEQFLQGTDFQGRLAENLESLRIETEQAFKEILTVIMDKTELPNTMQVRSEGEEFKVLCGWWESIKKMA